jgi:hypothetical protein
MKKTFALLSSGLFLLTLSAGWVFAQPAGKAIVDRACVKCHDTKRIESATKKAAEWEATLNRMISKGAAVKPAEREIVLKYLATLNK